MSGARGSPSQQLPSFASVYGEEAKGNQQRSQPSSYASGLGHTSTNQSQRREDLASHDAVEPSFLKYHQPRGSTSTSNSDNSAESSPTTTVSTLDSSSMTDASPNVSPESPGSHQSSNSFNGDSLRLRRGEIDNAVFTGAGQQATFDSSKPVLPTKKGRNLKNLAVNTSQAYALGKAISTAQFPLGQSNEAAKQGNTSAPASPAFIKPPTPPKRRQNNLSLSLLTPGPTKNLPALSIPQPQSFKRPNTLRHFQSSPSLPLMTSGLPPEGGMQLPPVKVDPQPRGFAEVPMEDEEEEELEPNFDIPQSREDKPEAYPDGPIRIYESGVDLYLEPTAEIASRYDVIFNVASEVRNPFSGLHVPPQQPQMSANVGILTKESQQQQSGSPTTPKATPLATELPTEITMPTVHRPEYIHIPWEHNTDIVPDLYKLVRDIDYRVQQGKRVLVHCQCGVSRSASLIVAYGLYKNPELSVQEAYQAVKKRSKWIGPNMNLIMQLQEFKAGLQRQGNNQYMFGLPRKLSSSIGPAAATPDSQSSVTPRTAPLHLDTSPQRASTGNIPLTAGAVHRGPSPAFFDPNFRRSWDAGKVGYSVEPPPMPTMGTSAYVNPKGQVVPVHKTAAEQASSDIQGTDQHAIRSKQPSQRKSVPNFSKRLPLRSESDDAEIASTSIDGMLASALQAPVLTPNVTAPRPENNFNMFAPVGFDALKPHRSSQETRTRAPTTLQLKAAPTESLLSPRSEHFAMNPISTNRSVGEDTHGLFSPTASHFPTDSPQVSAPPAPRQDSFVPLSSDEMADLKSPRSENFGMVGFSHMQSHEDEYGITSPIKTSFGNDPWAAILGTQHQGGQNLRHKHSQPPHPSGFERRSSTPPALTDASSPDGGATPSPPPTKHLDAHPRMLRPKYSSPNLAEQRRLQQLQTEIEAQLPHSSPKLGSPDDDALMSPRATEFTNNPFHDPVDDAPEASEHQVNATPKPQQTEFDPRSPAQHGISPITRSIYDVL